MANVRRETDRHKWREQMLTRGMQKVKGLLCMNCRAYRYLDEGGDPPVTGCRSGVDLTRAGNARLGDYREQEMRLRAEQDQRDLQEAGGQQPEMEMDRLSRDQFEQVQDYLKSEGLQ